MYNVIDGITYFNGIELVGGMPSGMLGSVKLAGSLEFLQKLSDGKVKFRFMRETYDKAQRWAQGTTNLQYIRQRYSFKGGTAPDATGLHRYWDIEKNKWRSFYIQNITEWQFIENL